jgi:hypothetical protein
MPGARFRQLAARMDAVLVARLGDRGVREDGAEVFGAFFSPFLGAELGGTHSFGIVANTDEVLEPTFTLRAIDAQGLVKGSPFTIDLPELDGGGAYTVVKPEPDGSGMVVLRLRLV